MCPFSSSGFNINNQVEKVTVLHIQQCPLQTLFGLEKQPEGFH